MRIRYHGYPWVRSIADERVQDFFKQYGKPRYIGKGDSVFIGRDYYPYIGLIINGMIGKYSEYFEFYKTSKSRAHSLLLPGSLIGNTFFLSGRSSNVSASALRESIILEVKEDFAWNYMRDNPVFMKQLLYAIMLDLESDLEGFATIVARLPEERLRVLFKILVRRNSIQPEKGWYLIPVNLTHAELSKVIYTTPLTTNKILLSWKKAKLMYMDKRKRYIHESLFEGIYDWLESPSPREHDHTE